MAKATASEIRKLTEEFHGSRKLGPLTPLVGYWEGDGGTDVSFHNKDDETAETGYFEKAFFKPIPVQENGQQVLWGLSYGMTAWRHGEEAMDPFHDEVGYILWDKANGQIMRTVVFGRGIALLAGSDAKEGDKVLRFGCKPGEACYGILQNRYLLERAELRSFTSTFTFNDDDTLTYVQTLVLKLATLGGKEMDHTDTNTLHRVRRIHPSEEGSAAT
ncbi:MAG: heme-binding beta-barrel domain-containing protein [Rhodanobacteraceae bacterium]